MLERNVCQRFQHRRSNSQTVANDLLRVLNPKFSRSGSLSRSVGGQHAIKKSSSPRIRTGCGGSKISTKAG